MLEDGPLAGRIALVSSFGAESAVLLHMVASVDAATPVIFLDTGKLFAEIQARREALVELLQLRDVRVIEPEWSRGRIEFNPLALWLGPTADVERYRALHHLPRHPLADRGYRSIGCVPCTRPVSARELQRAGRWRGFDKSECGIHLMDKAS